MQEPFAAPSDNSKIKVAILAGGMGVGLLSLTLVRLLEIIGSNSPFANISSPKSP